MGLKIMDIKDFIANKPNAEELRKKYPELGELLNGEFLEDKPNLYPKENPVVASWELEQFQMKNPTYGLFSPGHHKFPTGNNIETVIILEGNVETINPIDKIVGGYTQITAKDLLELHAKDSVTYLCLYTPKGEILF